MDTREGISVRLLETFSRFARANLRKYARDYEEVKLEDWLMITGSYHGELRAEI